MLLSPLKMASSREALSSQAPSPSTHACLGSRNLRKYPVLRAFSSCPLKILTLKCFLPLGAEPQLLPASPPSLSSSLSVHLLLIAVFMGTFVALLPYGRIHFRPNSTILIRALKLIPLLAGNALPSSSGQLPSLGTVLSCQLLGVNPP